jgi:hypothetical protein
MSGDACYSLLMCYCLLLLYHAVTSALLLLLLTMDNATLHCAIYTMSLQIGAAEEALLCPNGTATACSFVAAVYGASSSAQGSKYKVVTEGGGSQGAIALVEGLPLQAR